MTHQRSAIGTPVRTFVVIIVVLVGGIGLVEYSTQPNASVSRATTSANMILVPNPQPLSQCISGKPPGDFLIIANKNGFNNSVSYLRNWNGSKWPSYPLIEVARGSWVKILFCNLDQYESFGMTIDHYFPGGVVLPPNTASLITFKADQSGQFKLFNTVFNTVDLYAREGLLVVKAS